MQAIMESIFDAIYLVTIVTFGVLLLCNAKGRKQYILFGAMALLLGFGDSFHLAPRVYALYTTGVQDHAVSIGIGKFITSITMTLFYLLMYHAWLARYEAGKKPVLTASVYILAAARILLCLFPQNMWLSASAPLSWGIYRNIPFTTMGIIIIILFYQMAKKHNDKPFQFAWLAIILSFALYIPVVLLADTHPMIGMLMIPKTCAYVWAVIMAYSASKSTAAR